MDRIKQFNINGEQYELSLDQIGSYIEGQPIKEYINSRAGNSGLSVVTLTQAQYDALVEKDNMTLYIVTSDASDDAGGDDENSINGLKIRVQSIPDGEDYPYIKFVFNEKGFEIPLFRKWDYLMATQANYGLINYVLGDGDTPWAKWIPEIDGVSYDTDVYYKQEDGYEYFIYGSKVTVTYESPVEAEVISNPTIPEIGGDASTDSGNEGGETPEPEPSGNWTDNIDFSKGRALVRRVNNQTVYYQGDELANLVHSIMEGWFIAGDAALEEFNLYVLFDNNFNQPVSVAVCDYGAGGGEPTSDTFLYFYNNFAMTVGYYIQWGSDEINYFNDASSDDAGGDDENSINGLKIRVQSIPDGEDTAYVKFVFNEKNFELPLFRKWDNFLQSQANYGLGNYSFGDGDTDWAKWTPEIEGEGTYDTELYYKQEDGYEYFIYGSKVTVTYESPAEAEVISNPTIPEIGGVTIEGRGLIYNGVLYEGGDSLMDMLRVLNQNDNTTVYVHNDQTTEDELLQYIDTSEGMNIPCIVIAGIERSNENYFELICGDNDGFRILVNEGELEFTDDTYLEMSLLGNVSYYSAWCYPTTQFLQNMQNNGVENLEATACSYKYFYEGNDIGTITKTEFVTDEVNGEETFILKLWVNEEEGKYYWLSSSSFGRSWE